MKKNNKMKINNIQNSSNSLMEGGLEQINPWDYSDIVLYKDELVK
jgi:hypothetical protein